MHSRFIQLLEHLIYLTDYCKDRRPDRATCRNVSAEFNSAPELSCAVLNMILSSNEDGLSNVRLLFIVRLLGFLKKNIDAITMSLQDVASTPELDHFFDSFESLTKPVLLARASLHQLPIPSRLTSLHAHPPPGCSRLANVYKENKDLPVASDVFSSELQIYILTSGVEFSTQDSLSKLRRVLKAYIRNLQAIPVLFYLCCVC